MNGTETLNQEEMWGHKDITSDVLNGDGKKYIHYPSKCHEIYRAHSNPVDGRYGSLLGQTNTINIDAKSRGKGTTYECPSIRKPMHKL
jgi:hypothetical protein